MLHLFEFAMETRGRCGKSVMIAGEDLKTQLALNDSFTLMFSWNGYALHGYSPSARATLREIYHLSSPKSGGYGCENTIMLLLAC